MEPNKGCLAYAHLVERYMENIHMLESRFHVIGVFIVWCFEGCGTKHCIASPWQCYASAWRWRFKLRFPVGPSVGNCPHSSYCRWTRRGSSWYYCQAGVATRVKALKLLDIMLTGTSWAVSCLVWLWGYVGQANIYPCNRYSKVKRIVYQPVLSGFCNGKFSLAILINPAKTLYVVYMFWGILYIKHYPPVSPICKSRVV